MANISHSVTSSNFTNMGVLLISVTCLKYTLVELIVEQVSVHTRRRVGFG